MGKSQRIFLDDKSYIDWSIHAVAKDRWRPHGVRYRIAWVDKGVCRVLFDNHHGKEVHVHLDGNESAYLFISVEKLWNDFLNEIRKRGGLE